MAIQPINYGALSGDPLGSYFNARNQVQNLQAGGQRLALGNLNIQQAEQQQQQQQQQQHTATANTAARGTVTTTGFRGISERNT